MPLAAPTAIFIRVCQDSGWEFGVTSVQFNEQTASVEGFMVGFMSPIMKCSKLFAMISTPRIHEQQHAHLRRLQLRRFLQPHLLAELSSPMELPDRRESGRAPSCRSLHANEEQQEDAKHTTTRESTSGATLFKIFHACMQALARHAPHSHPTSCTGRRRRRCTPAAPAGTSSAALRRSPGPSSTSRVQFFSQGLEETAGISRRRSTLLLLARRRRSRRTLPPAAAAAWSPPRSRAPWP